MRKEMFQFKVSIITLCLVVLFAVFAPIYGLIAGVSAKLTHVMSERTLAIQEIEREAFSTSDIIID